MLAVFMCFKLVPLPGDFMTLSCQRLDMFVRTPEMAAPDTACRRTLAVGKADFGWGCL